MQYTAELENGQLVDGLYAETIEELEAYAQMSDEERAERLQQEKSNYFTQLGKTEEELIAEMTKNGTTTLPPLPEPEKSGWFANSWLGRRLGLDDDADKRDNWFQALGKQFSDNNDTRIASMPAIPTTEKPGLWSRFCNSWLGRRFGLDDNASQRDNWFVTSGKWIKNLFVSEDKTAIAQSQSNVTQQQIQQERQAQPTKSAPQRQPVAQRKAPRQPVVKEKPAPAEKIEKQPVAAAQNVPQQPTVDMTTTGAFTFNDTMTEFTSDEDLTTIDNDSLMLQQGMDMDEQSTTQAANMALEPKPNTLRINSFDTPMPEHSDTMTESNTDVTDSAFTISNETDSALTTEVKKPSRTSSFTSVEALSELNLSKETSGLLEQFNQNGTNITTTPEESNPLVKIRTESDKTN